MNKIIIKTKLNGREDVFKYFYAAMETRLPVLLLGEMGTGKTLAFMDFSKSVNSGKTFVKQFNFDMRQEDILGYLNLPALKEGRVERINGIQDAEYILLDEIDKTSTSVRNLVLSILRERQVFDGGNIVDCKWKLLVGTSNRLEFDEEDKPFLDRFVLKYKIERLGLSKIDDLLFVKEKEIELKIVDVDENLYEKGINIIKKVLSDIYEELSDRTIVQLPKILKAFMKINNNNVNQSVVDTIAAVTSREKAISLVEKLNVYKYLTKVQEQAKIYNSASDENTKSIALAQIIELRRTARMDTSVDRDEVAEIEKIYKSIADK